MLPYERFQAWQTCHELTQAVYRTTQRWPQNELYGLTAQARRAAFSAAANIAEGSAKRGAREFRRDLDISLGSLSELSYIFLLAKDLGLLHQEEFASLDPLRDRAGKLVWGLCRSLTKTGGTQTAT
jgi:four helix bundle protein